MTRIVVPEPGAAGGRLADNVVHFVRLLRAAGIRAGPGETAAAIAAAKAVGLARRDDLRAALAAVVLARREDRAVFDQAFDLFWRDPQLLARTLHALLPKAAGAASARAAPARRVADAFRPPQSRPDRPQDRLELDARLTVSDRETLRSRDFESMTADELAQARRAIAALRVTLSPLPTRRLRPAPDGPVLDLRRTLRSGLRTGGEWVKLRRSRRRRRPPALVALCDVSGSMAHYSRMLLHLLHAFTADRRRVHTFAFGTRLTDVTRLLRHRDPDVALELVGRTVPDWSGGTRIGECLRAFNLGWSRRLLAQGAVVLMITDGLDCEGGEGLAEETARLRRACRRLLWLNPLLRFEGFEPRAGGIRAMLPHVDRMIPAHNVDSLADLGRALAATRARHDGQRRRPQAWT